MKYLISIFLTILLSLSQVNAASYKNGIEPRIDVVNENSFFVLNLEDKGVTLNYGDRVELVFGYGFNNRVTIYNVSSDNSNIFTNKNELAAFIDPEYLRCFQKKQLRKVIIYSGSERVVIKTNIAANQL